MLYAVISHLLKTSLLARVPMLLFLLVSGVTGNLSGLVRVSDWAESYRHAERVNQVISEFALHSSTLYLNVDHWQNLKGVGPSSIDDETLWLARCIFSETKDTEEMTLVGWVVRNRVETGYRGRSSYRAAVLDPFQFSAFNSTSSTRFFYSNLRPGSRVAGWENALRVAYMVRTANASDRPFPTGTRHFYSERSMVGRSSPVWVDGMEPVNLDGTADIDVERFRFYDGVS